MLLRFKCFVVTTILLLSVGLQVNISEATKKKTQSKTTGPIQTPEKLEFTKINIQRMHRLDKTVSPTFKNNVQNNSSTD